MTSKSNHEGESALTQNQNNAMSEDPGDGQRLTDKPGAIGHTPAEKKPKNDIQDQGTIEEFGREGMGVAAKE
jgi:hypothetical protein